MFVVCLETRVKKCFKRNLLFSNNFCAEWNHFIKVNEENICVANWIREKLNENDPITIWLKLLRRLWKQSGDSEIGDESVSKQFKD